VCELTGLAQRHQERPFFTLGGRGWVLIGHSEASAQTQLAARSPGGHQGVGGARLDVSGSDGRSSRGRGSDVNVSRGRGRGRGKGVEGHNWLLVVRALAQHSEKYMAKISEVKERLEKERHCKQDRA
jgi:hypothetical protein